MRLLLAHSPHLQAVEDVTEMALLRFFHDSVRTRGWSTTTLDTYQRRLNTFFTWAEYRRLIPENPMRFIERPTLPKSAPKSLPQNQAMRVLEAANVVGGDTPFLRARSKAIVATCIFAGLRRTELLNLEIQDVDLPNGLLSVIEGKGAKDRRIPISQPLATVLKVYLDERAKLVRLTPAFFTAERFDRPLHDVMLDRLVRRIEAQVGFHFSLHMLRHTFATLLMEGGCNLYALSELMGHSNVRTTTIYLSNTVDHLRAQVALHPMFRPMTPVPDRGTFISPARPAFHVGGVQRGFRYGGHIWS